jgi:hypothetical protein
MIAAATTQLAPATTSEVEIVLRGRISSRRRRARCAALHAACDGGGA